MFALRFFALMVVAFFAPAVEAAWFQCTAPDEVFRYRLFPDCVTANRVPRLGRFNIRINSQGLIAPKNFAPAKAARDRYRILIVGGSLTSGIGDKYSIEFDLDAVLNQRNILDHNGKKMKFETINASVPGYGLIHIRLWLPTLIERFRPDLIILDQAYLGRVVSLWFDHVTAEKIGEDSGLVEKLGFERELWPLPQSMTRWLWGLEVGTAQRLRLANRVMRMSLYNLYLRLGLYLEGWNPKMPSPYVRLHMKYLRAIKQLTDEQGVNLVLTNWIERDFSLEKYVHDVVDTEMWFDSDRAMLRIFSSRLITRADVLFQEWNIKKDFDVFDLSKLGLKPEDRIYKDFHLNHLGLKKVGRELAKSVEHLLLVNKMAKKTKSPERRAKLWVGGPQPDIMAPLR